MIKQMVMGVVLAGGQGRRMGGRHKAFLQLDNRPLVEHVISRLRSQTDDLIISANHEREQLGLYGYPVIADEHTDSGPLAGVLAVMNHMRRNAPQIQWLLTVAVDTPLFPADYRQRMIEAVQTGNADMACATSGGRLHPVFALWPVTVYAELKRAVEVDGQRKIGQWIRQRNSVAVEFCAGDVDPFFNINTPEDLQKAARTL